MPVTVHCPNPDCRKAYSVADEQLGRASRCEHCGEKLTPSAAGTAVASQQPTLDSEVIASPGGAAAGSTPTLPQQIGRFQIRDQLGAGAFGAVYRAFDPQLEREVALKVPHPGTLKNPSILERFLREARSAAQLRHPHIVPVFEAGEADGQQYIASALIKGQTLAAQVEDGELTARQAAQIVQQLAAALADAHQQGIVHRDIKPANIMLDEHQQPLIMDFGLAHSAEASQRLTNTGALLGTPAYMAPEQASGQERQPLPASDQYSLGVVLYELLTGQLPFAAPHVAALVYQIIGTAPPPPRQVKPAIPPALERICLKAMAKQPEQRYTDCQALADDLELWLASGVASVPRVQSSEDSAKTFPDRPRHKSRAGIAALLAGLLLMGTAITAATQWDKLRPWFASNGPAIATGDRSTALARDITNSIGMKLALIPAGKFTMGSPLFEKDRNAEEVAHDVEITRPFYMGIHEVTIGQWRAFVKDVDYQTEAEKDGQGSSGFNATTGKLESRKPEYTWKNTGWAQTDAHPVVNVTGNDAVAFCQWLSRKEGKTYRLPTEAEWEYACRAGTTTRFHGGEAEESLQTTANVADASFKAKYAAATWAKEWDDGYPFTAPVGRFQANAFGLYDMHGNVWEWCQDYWQGSYSPDAQRDPQGPQTGHRRLVRGGAWENVGNHCRSAHRSIGELGSRAQRSYGFRVVVAPRTP